MSKYGIRPWEVVVEEIDDTPFTMNDISAITKECSEVNVQYLARNLKIDYDDFRENPFEECIKHWIMRKYPVDEIGEPSWRTLAKAVKRIVLAHQIAKNHPKGKTLGLKSPSDNIGAVIIVTNTYSGKDYIESPRKDGEKLSEAFKALKNFDVYWKENVNRIEMTKYIEEVGRLELKFLKNYRCIIFIFSGHGDNDYVVMQDNSRFPIFEDIIEPLLPENAPGIKAIPKVFLFDACRGDRRTGTMEVKHEVKSSISIIEKSLLAKLGENDTVAKQGNIMVAYATLPGHESYGAKQDGGYWLSTLADLLNKDDWYKNSLEVLLTEVSRVMQESIRDNPKDFLQPVRVSLLNQHICLNLKPDFGNKNAAGLSS